MSDLSIYLNPTYYIDYDSPLVKEKAEKFLSSFPEEKARAIFYFVRDRVIYTPYSPFYLPEHYKASMILERGSGYCVQKAILLTALARANNIPFVFHGYNELYINGRWVKITPTFDIGMCKKLNLRPVEFDGQNNATFHTHDLNGQKHIEYIKDYGHFTDLPFEKMMSSFRRHYTKDMLKRWKGAVIDRQNG
jgi:transglutaminase-like putative cysteine protease